MIDKKIEKTIDIWTNLIMDSKVPSTHWAAGWGRNIAKKSIHDYITEFYLLHNKLPSGEHDIPIRSGANKQVNFDLIIDHFENKPMKEENSSNDKPSDTFDNEIYCPAKDIETLRDEYSNYIDNSNILEFKGTLIEGPEVNLLELSGLELTRLDEIKIWEQDDSINERDLLIWHLDCEEFELYEIDDSPMHSDVYVKYYCGDFDEFLNKLRSWIIDYLSNQ